MICHEMFSAGTAVKPVHLEKFSGLDDDRRRRIKTWWKRARKLSGLSKQDDFEPFVFAWLAFNGWGMLITGAANDAEMVKSLASDAAMQQAFQDLKNNEESELENLSNSFISLLPIFDVNDLIDKNLLRWDDQARSERVDFYLRHGANEFEPKCWKRHLSEEALLGTVLPTDWEHTLKAIYKVRCNLFHGNKSAFIENDKNIVKAAYRVLFSFIEEGNYFR